jgi:hypothetical protein
MLSYSGRTPGLSGVIPSVGGVPRGQPPPPRQEKAHPRGMRRHWTSGIDGLESGLLFVQDPVCAQLALLCARALIDAYSASFKTQLWEYHAMTLRSI